MSFTYVRQSNGRGLGVFATIAFEPGDVIAVEFVIVIPSHEVQLVSNTVLGHYYYEWGDDNTLGAIVLGQFSLVNHSYTPNVSYDEAKTPTYPAVLPKPAMVFKAIKHIGAGDELLINYNGNEGGDEPLWFLPV